MGPFTLPQACKMLPLVKSIAAELIERRADRDQATKLKRHLEESCSPEGLEGAIHELANQIEGHDAALTKARLELEALGLTVLRMSPLTIHFPGRAELKSVVFCWMEGDESIEHGHLIGEEKQPRRPLQIRTPR